jgi:hypothetical protein
MLPPGVPDTQQENYDNAYFDDKYQAFAKGD